MSKPIVWENKKKNNLPSTEHFTQHAKRYEFTDCQTCDTVTIDFQVDFTVGDDSKNAYSKANHTKPKCCRFVWDSIRVSQRVYQVLTF